MIAALENLRVHEAYMTEIIYLREAVALINKTNFNFVTFLFSLQDPEYLKRDQKIL